MQKIKIYPILFVGLLAVALRPSVVAQEDKTEHEQSTAKSTTQKPVGSYRLEFSLSEIEDGKKINSRSYAMLAEAGGVLNKLRIGARVPVAAVSFRSGDVSTPVNTQYQYIDVGMNIDCRIQEQEGSVVLSVTIDSSSFTQPPALSRSEPNQPVINQLRTDVNAVVGLGKPTVITSADDPSSKRRFEMEVTAIKAK